MFLVFRHKFHTHWRIQPKKIPVIWLIAIKHTPIFGHNLSIADRALPVFIQKPEEREKNEKLPVEPADIQAICSQSMEYLHGREKEGVSCVLDIPAQTLIIETNAYYLISVLENLLDNAVKFTESGSIILHYETDQVKKKLLISITDSVCGISPEMHQKFFERFYKLDAYKPGNGLGLYLCRLIIERLDGAIYIDPAYTRGTLMWVELPLK